LAVTSSMLMRQSAMGAVHLPQVWS